MINKNPKVTVLMPVYNGEKYLREAIESILNQTFTDFEFLIVNDGSTDKSEEIINSYKDSRIRLVNNEMNKGVVFSLNKGLDLAKGKYVVRMDNDDISLPKRLETQVEFMKKHPEIGVAGAWAKTIGNKNKKYIKTYFNIEKIKANLLFGTSVIHPSVIIDKERINKYNLRYSENCRYAEDYDLWSRSIKYFSITNINKVLLLYRDHDSNLSKIVSKENIQTSVQIRKKQLKENLDIDPSNEDMIIHQSIYRPKNINLQDYLKRKEMWFNKLIEQNKKTKFYKEPEFSQVLAQRWLKICSVNSNKDFKIFKYFWKSGLRKKLDWKEFESWKMTSRFFIKCLI